MALKEEGFVKNIKGISKYYKQGGLLEVIYRLTAYDYIPEWLLFLESTTIMVLESFNEKAVRRNLSGYEFKVADKSYVQDLIDCTGEEAEENTQEIFQRFFDEGYKCIVIRDSGKTVAYAWSFARKYILTFDDYKRNIVLSAKENDVFFGTGLIANEYRLKGLFPSMIKYMMEQYPDGTNYYTAVDYRNVHSYKSHCRLGYAPLLSIICISLFRVSAYFIKNDDKTISFLGFGSPTLELSDYLSQK
jgi:hypothetical protein